MPDECVGCGQFHLDGDREFETCRRCEGVFCPSCFDYDEWLCVDCIEKQDAAINWGVI